MKPDVAKTVNDLDGNPIKKDGKDFTLRDAIESALLSPIQGDDKKPEEGFTRFMLAMKIHESDAPDLTIDEAKLIKDRVAKCYPALTVGRVWQALEGSA